MPKLARTEPAGQVMKVHTDYYKNVSGAARIRVTVYAYNGVRYIKAQQKSVPFRYSARDAHEEAVREAFDAPLMKLGVTNSGNGWKHWAVIA